MIPAIAPSILEANPQFASLHKRITTNLLNHDASTSQNTKGHDQVANRLHQHRLRAAKEELLRFGLSNVAAGGQEKEDKDLLKLPSELRELVGTVCMLLEGAPYMDLSEDDYDLLGPDIDEFHNNLQHIASAVGQDLQQQRNVLCKIVAAATSSAQDLPPTKYAANSKRPFQPTLPSSTSSAATSLPPLLHPLLPTIPNPSLQTALTTLSNTTIAHATTYRALLNTTITHLERTTYGLETRHLKARSAHLSTVASGLAARIQMQYLQCRNKLYRTEVQIALGNYQRHLEALEGGLVDREGELKGVVEEYEDVGDGQGQGQKGLMREVGRRYGEVLSEIEKVKGEIERLEDTGDRGGLVGRGLGKG